MVWVSVVIGFALLLIIFGSVAGNVLVVCAVTRDRSLHSPANFLICSLAVTDLLLACLVMPVSALYQILDAWILGSVLCQVWTATDIACCTASILHLCAVALERYQSITNAVKYFSERMTRSSAPKIIIVWALAICISIPPILGWKPSSSTSASRLGDLSQINEENVTSNGTTSVSARCQVGHHPGYTVYATLGSFYIPLAFLLVVYTRIYVLIHRQIKRSESRSRIFSWASEEQRKSLSVRSRASPPRGGAQRSRLADDAWKCSRWEGMQQRTYGWRAGPFSYQTIRREENEMTNVYPTVTQQNKVAFCDRKGTPGLKTNDNDGSGREKRRRPILRRQVAIAEDSDSEIRSAPTCVQYSTAPVVAENDLQSEESSQMSSKSNQAARRTLCRKCHSETDVTYGRKVSDFDFSAETHRPRTQTAGHVHFADRTDSTRVITGDVTRSLMQQRSEQNSREDVFHVNSARRGFAPFSKYLIRRGMCCLSTNSSGSSTSSDNSRFLRVASSSPQLLNSLSMRAKIKVLKAREIRAIRTLGTIVGAFVVCWLPFMVVTLAQPFCNCQMPPALLSVVLWLGYCNSLLNPILYAAFNREFHAAFRKLLSRRITFVCKSR